MAGFDATTEIESTLIKELPILTTISDTDDLLIETAPATGVPRTGRTKVKTLKEMFNREFDSTLKGIMIQYGRVSINPVANKPTMEHVQFPKTFAGQPCVVVTPVTSVPGTNILGAGATNNTSAGFDAYITRTNTTETILAWIAIGPV
ncbi:gp53-like domain-containing protein [Blautia producta]|uniref:gp53-like domain-containing protein n=1 Tax=Blautia producta TaxID=33035 RepID=UPI0036F4180D